MTIKNQKQDQPAFMMTLLYSVLGLGITFIFVNNSNSFSEHWTSVINRLSSMNVAGLWLCVTFASFTFLGHMIRALKSKLLFQPVAYPSFGTLFQNMSIGFLFNSLIPFRLGELCRAILLARSLGISFQFVLLNIVIERVFDAFFIFLFLVSYKVWGTPLPSHSSLLPTLDFSSGYTYVIFILGAIAGLIVLSLGLESQVTLRTIYKLTTRFSPPLRTRIQLSFWTLIQTIKLLLSETAWIRYFFLSFAMWGFYFSGLAGLIHFFAGNITSTQSCLGSATAYFSMLTPTGPTSLGNFTASYAPVLKQLMFPLEMVGPLLPTVWLVLIVPISLVGLWSIFFMPLANPKANTALTSKDLPLHFRSFLRRKGSHNDLISFLDGYFGGSVILRKITNLRSKNDSSLVRLLNGGSNAITFVSQVQDTLKVEKWSVGEGAHKLHEQYQWLMTHQETPGIPKVYQGKKEKEFFSYQMEFLSTATDFFNFIHTHPISESRRLVDDLWHRFNTHVYKERTEMLQPTRLKAYIEEKGIEKLNSVAALHQGISDLMQFREISVNGRKMDNLPHVLEKILRDSELRKILEYQTDSPIHGDLTVENLVVNSEMLFVLDPNNENVISDPVVDAGKLLQSFRGGYEFLKKTNQVHVVGSQITFSDFRSWQYQELTEHCINLFSNTLPNSRFQSLDFHTAIHFCRLLPYRAKNEPATLPIFYARATEILNDFVNTHSAR